MSVQRWVAVVLAAAGLYVLAGPGWALLGLAGVLATMPLPGVAEQSLSAERALRRVWGRVRRFGGSVASWASPGRLAAVLLPAGLALTAAGAGLMAGPGGGLAAAGVLMLLGGVLLDRRAPDPAVGR